MKCFPQELGLLFKKHNKTYAIKEAFKFLGQNKTMQIIKRCMPLSNDYPILHIVHSEFFEIDKPLIGFDRIKYVAVRTEIKDYLIKEVRQPKKLKLKKP